MGRIVIKDLGKAYKTYPTKVSRLKEWLIPSGKLRHNLKWVLQDVNFTVQPGEAVGIIGVNGAGKSTLLKMITGTTKPTTGSIHITGRVAALLELGMGFHPDFTGRQNAVMAAQLLGLSNEEIETRMPEVEAFAEIGEYIEQPVRVYSSGMQVRLAFSVATCLRPDILIIDEALSVGDIYFQHKSFERIKKFKELGTTLLIVSHDISAIKNICETGILLDGNTIAYQGKPDDVFDYYNAIMSDNKPELAEVSSIHGNSQGMRSGSQAVSISSVKLVKDGLNVSKVEQDSSVCIKVEINANEAIKNTSVGVLIRDRLGNDIFGTNTELAMQRIPELRSGASASVEFIFPKLRLGVGNYSVSVAIHDAAGHVENNYDWWDKAMVFEVFHKNTQSSVGLCVMDAQCNVTLMD